MVEFGSGTGNLTQALLDQGKRAGNRAIARDAANRQVKTQSF